MSCPREVRSHRACSAADDDGHFEYNYVRGLSQPMVNVKTIATTSTTK